MTQSPPHPARRWSNAERVCSAWIVLWLSVFPVAVLPGSWLLVERWLVATEHDGAEGLSSPLMMSWAITSVLLSATVVAHLVMVARGHRSRVRVALVPIQFVLLACHLAVTLLLISRQVRFDPHLVPAL